MLVDPERATVTLVSLRGRRLDSAPYTVDPDGVRLADWGPSHISSDHRDGRYDIDCVAQLATLRAEMVADWFAEQNFQASDWEHLRSVEGDLRGAYHDAIAVDPSAPEDARDALRDAYEHVVVNRDSVYYGRPYGTADTHLWSDNYAEWGDVDTDEYNEVIETATAEVDDQGDLTEYGRQRRAEEGDTHADAVYDEGR